MQRAAQLLLPFGGALRASAVAAALATAETRWRGDAGELRRVLAARNGTSGDADANFPFDVDRPVFARPPTAEDALRRFAGAVHVRALPPHLENEIVDVEALRGKLSAEDIAKRHANNELKKTEYAAFLADMTGEAKRGRLWDCAADAARKVDLVDATGTLFLATDSGGLCGIASNGSRVACFDIEPARGGADDAMRPDREDGLGRALCSRG